MRISISFFLACATIALAVPFRSTTHHAELLGKLNQIVRSNPDLKLSTRQSGLNFAECGDDSSCVGGRLCTAVMGDVVSACAPGSALCRCLPLNPLAVVCTSATDCDQGETCITAAQPGFCVADEIAPIFDSEGIDLPSIPVPGVDNESGDDDDESDDDDNDAVDVPLIGDVGGEGFVPASSGKGLTADACSSDAECTAPRTCSDSPKGGLCLPEEGDECSSNADCVDGEVCVGLELGIICVSDAVVQANLPNTQAPSTTASADSTVPVTTGPTTTGTVSDSDNQTTPGTTDDDSGNPVSGGSEDDKPGATKEPQSEDSNVSTSQLGLSFDPCQDADDCDGARTCLSTDGTACDNQNDCRCLGVSGVCENDSDCDEGEGCFDAGDVVEDAVNIPFIPSDLIQVKICISRAARDEAVCIASHSLDHISREELVFEKDAIAHVLCDINESCATPGHMVQYKGKGMMMKSYCELTSCVRKVMTVNSPKYRRGLTVPSHTDDLVFTALAARFQSRAEEGVLSAAVRIGF